MCKINFETFLNFMKYFKRSEIFYIQNHMHSYYYFFDIYSYYNFISIS